MEQLETQELPVQLETQELPVQLETQELATGPTGDTGATGPTGDTGTQSIQVNEDKGGDNAWDTRPTFGISHETREDLLVQNGFMFNNEVFTVSDNHHTSFIKKSINIGQMNSFAAKVYADKGLQVQEFLFGVPNVGDGHLAEMRVEVWYNFNREIEEVKVKQNSRVIDPTTLSVSHQKSRCLPSDTKEKCDTTLLSMTFLEPLKDNVMAIKAIDFKNRDQTTYLNDGFVVIGTSLNPMKTEMIPSNIKSEGLVKVTQLEKYSPYWITDDGRIFEKNSFGSFTQINQKFERFQDKGEPRTRLHSGFGGIIEKEKIKAVEIFDSRGIISELPPSFAYEFPETVKRIDEKTRQEMLIQEQIAKKILDRYFG